MISGATRLAPADRDPPALRLLTFSTLFPNAARPNHGVFVENRLRHLVASHPVTAAVMAPVPFFPFRSARFGAWSEHARAPRREMRHGLVVHHPRYGAIPRVGMSVAPLFLYRAAIVAARQLLVEGERFDLVDAHYLYPDGVAAEWLGRTLGLPVVVTARGSDVSLLPRHAVPRRMIQAMLGRADGVIAVSAALRTAMVELGAAPERITVLRNGVDTDLFHPLDRGTARAALGLTRPTLISVGLLIDRKGHHRVIEAMASLPEFELLVVGEGPERPRLEALIARLGLAGRVRLLGARPHSELAACYAAADALVLASSREGWANVLLEAMACGTPVIAARIWGNPEVVQEKVAGLIYDENTPEGIVAGVKALFADLPDRAATRAYAERFSWDATSAGQFQLFNAILKR